MSKKEENKVIEGKTQNKGGVISEPIKLNYTTSKSKSQLKNYYKNKTNLDIGDINNKCRPHNTRTDDPEYYPEIYIDIMKKVLKDLEEPKKIKEKGE